MTTLYSAIALFLILGISTAAGLDQAHATEHNTSAVNKLTSGGFRENETTARNLQDIHDFAAAQNKSSQFVQPRKYFSLVKYDLIHLNASGVLPTFSSIKDVKTKADILSPIPNDQRRVLPKKPDVRIGVLLPFAGNLPYIIYKVAPALEKAVDRVTSQMGPWSFNSLTLLYADTKCDNAESMNQAIQMEEHKKTAAFFGPVCDYAVAPVARQCKFWKTPLITAGGSALDYKMYKNTTYPTLTRVGPANLQASIELIRSLFIENNWSKIKILYDPKGQSSHLDNFCYFWVEYFVYQRGEDIATDHKILGDSYMTSPRKFFMTEISTQYAVKRKCSSEDL